MNDPDNFLSRWSRRKREGSADNSQPEKSGEQSNDRIAPPREQSRQAIPKDEAASPPPPEFDVASLPPIESIDAGVTTTVDWSHGLQTTDHAEAAVDALTEVPGRFVRTLAAIRDQKEKQAA